MATVSNIYLDGTYASQNPTFGDDGAGWKVTNTLKAIREFNIPYQTLAEVGCGGGAIIRDLAEILKVDRAVGYEPMPEAFAVAKERSTHQLSFVNQTVDETIKEDFDLVLCFDVFEHIEDYFKFLRDIQNLSQRFLFHIPLDMNVQMVARMSPILMVRDVVGHIHYFSKETALATLRDCGLTVKGYFYTFGGDSPYQSRLYQLMKLPRQLAFCLNQDLTVRFLGGYSLMVYAVLESDE